MLTKRMATVAIFSGVLAKMAHADDPNWKPTTSTGNIVSAFNRPTAWTVNLDQMTHLDVLLDGKKVTISAAEIFAALQP